MTMSQFIYTLSPKGHLRILWTFQLNVAVLGILTSCLHSQGNPNVHYCSERKKTLNDVITKSIIIQTMIQFIEEYVMPFLFQV